MKKRFTEEQIIGIIKEQEAGERTADVCRHHDISQATFFKYKSKYGGMEVSDARKLRVLGTRRPMGEYLTLLTSVGALISSLMHSPPSR